MKDENSFQENRGMILWSSRETDKTGTEDFCSELSIVGSRKSSYCLNFRNLPTKIRDFDRTSSVQVMIRIDSL
jgi:hypothetical protein